MLFDKIFRALLTNMVQQPLYNRQTIMVIEDRQGVSPVLTDILEITISLEGI